MSRATSFIRPTLIAVALTVLAAGCGKKYEVGQVEGTVSLNGRPLKQIMVHFMPDPDKGTEGPLSTALTDDEGRYQMRYYDPASKRSGEGAVVGWHRVVLEDMSRPATPQGQPAPPLQLSPIYSTAGSTPLLYEVQPGKQTIDLPLAPP